MKRGGAGVVFRGDVHVVQAGQRVHQMEVPAARGEVQARPPAAAAEGILSTRNPFVRCLNLRARRLYEKILREQRKRRLHLRARGEREVRGSVASLVAREQTPRARVFVNLLVHEERARDGTRVRFLTRTARRDVKRRPPVAVARVEVRVVRTQQTQRLETPGRRGDVRGGLPIVVPRVHVATHFFDEKRTRRDVSVARGEVQRRLSAGRTRLCDDPNVIKGRRRRFTKRRR